MDEVSDDFLLKAYEMCQGEWPSFESKQPEWCRRGGWRPTATPLLISDCERLILDWDPKKKVYHRYPYKMPMFDIKVIELIGTILRYEQKGTNITLHVCDGTGTMAVNYTEMQYKRLKKRRSLIDRYYEITEYNLKTATRLMNLVITDNHHPRIAYESAKVKLTPWWKASSKGMFGKDLMVGDYVNVIGRVKLKHPPKHTDETPWDSGVLPEMEFSAVHVDAIDEETYETKFQEFIDKAIEKYAVRDTNIEDMESSDPEELESPDSSALEPPVSSELEPPVSSE